MEPLSSWSAHAEPMPMLSSCSAHAHAQLMLRERERAEQKLDWASAFLKKNCLSAITGCFFKNYPFFCHKSEPSKQYMSLRIIWRKFATIANLATNQELTLLQPPKGCRTKTPHRTDWGLFGIILEADLTFETAFYLVILDGFRRSPGKCWLLRCLEIPAGCGAGAFGSAGAADSKAAGTGYGALVWPWFSVYMNIFEIIWIYIYIRVYINVSYINHMFDQILQFVSFWETFFMFDPGAL